MTKQKQKVFKTLSVDAHIYDEISEAATDSQKSNAAIVADMMDWYVRNDIQKEIPLRKRDGIRALNLHKEDAEKISKDAAEKGYKKVEYFPEIYELYQQKE